jgi:hypothetical protein
VLKCLTCRLSGHRQVARQTPHPVGRDIIAERTVCSRCGKVLRSWPPPLGAPNRAPVFYVEPQVVPVAELDPHAWSIMCWRQDRLPPGRVRHRADWDSLRIVERRAASKVAKRLGLGSLHSSSLVRHHCDGVEAKLTSALPSYSRERDSTGSLRGAGVTVSRGFIRRPRAPNFTIGWGTWFQNRRVGFRWRIFRLRNLNAFRGIGLQQRRVAQSQSI